jgi:hypothetical protein
MKQQRLERVRPKRRRTREVAEDVLVDEPDGDLLHDIDDLLDEIDSVLEDQSMLFEFRQRPGQ